MSLPSAWLLVLTTLVTQVPTDYVVLVDAGKNNELLPAAKSLADFHKAKLLSFDAAKLDEAFTQLKQLQPKYVVFVVPPEKIDVDLAHAILSRSTKLDDDPFCDFEYGFLTGRDRDAALRFVERIKKAWKRDYGRKIEMFGSWEGVLLPFWQRMTALKTLKATGSMHLVRTRSDKAARHRAAQKGLKACQGKDLLLFFSHGYPDEMAACFRAENLRDWKVNLAPSVLINCSCYNGAPGRWYAPSKKGLVDKGLVKRQDSVALQILDSGVVGYFGGIDVWHGPLAFQVFGHVFDDGLRLGQAANMMHNRLAIEFLPKRIHFPPALKNKNRFSSDGTTFRRHNGADMIFYGDPKLAPFAKSATQLRFGKLTRDGKRLQIKLGTKPLLQGQPGEDFMLPQSWLTDYYSMRSSPAAVKELTLEIYRVMPLPKNIGKISKVQVMSAKCGKRTVPTKTPQLVIEQTPTGRYLHVRVPIDARAIGSQWPIWLSREGVVIQLEGIVQ